jgi:hypothetical protein
VLKSQTWKCGSLKLLNSADSEVRVTCRMRDADT